MCFGVAGGPMRVPGAVLAVAFFLSLFIADVPVGNDLIEPAMASAGSLRPGDRLDTNLGSCTLNFVYDGVGPLAGRVYMGSAGHCTSVGELVDSNGVPNFGVTAYDNDDVDFAFIEVLPAFVGIVNPTVLGHPNMPTGVTSWYSDTAVGDTLLLSGHGMGMGFSAATREKRIGALVSDNAERFVANAMLVNGDSGGPILHEKTGKALGIVSAYGFGAFPPSTDVGPTVAYILEVAAADGFPVELRPAP